MKELRQSSDFHFYETGMILKKMIFGYEIKPVRHTSPARSTIRLYTFSGAIEYEVIRHDAADECLKIEKILYEQSI